MDRPKKRTLSRIIAFSRKRLAAALGSDRRVRTEASSAVSSVRFKASSGLEGFVDRFGPTRIHGWVRRRQPSAEAVVLTFYDGERYLCSATANRKRPDLAQPGQPETSSQCGFELPVPDELCDAREHAVDIRLAGKAESVLSSPILIRIDAAVAKPDSAAKQSPATEAAAAAKTQAPAAPQAMGNAAASEPPPRGRSVAPTLPPLKPIPRASPFAAPVGASRKPAARSADYLASLGDLTALRRSLADRLAFGGEVATGSAALGQRLRRERALCEAATAGRNVSNGTLVLLAESGDPASVRDTLRDWMLQSHPLIDAVIVADDPAFASAEGAATLPADQTALMQGALSRAAWCVFARPADLLAPSTVALLNRLPATTDVVLWSLFTPAQSGAPAGVLHRRPEFDPHTVRHNPTIDTTFAVRGRILADCPAAVFSALGAGRVHPLLFWLSTVSGLSWHTYPGALTIRPASLRARDQRADVERDESVYRMLSGDLAADFDLRKTRADLPFPLLFVPRRRASRISVVIASGTGATLLRCLNSIARQQITSDIEVIVVADSTAHRGDISERARQIFGADIVALVDGGTEPNDSARINKGVAAAGGEVVVICRDDVVFLDSTILEQIAAWSLQPGIGTVSCGLREGVSGDEAYGYAAAPASPNPFAPVFAANTDTSHAEALRSAAGNTRVLMAIEQRKFSAVGGFDEIRFPARQNDVEFMLRCARHGLTHLYLGHLRASFTGALSAPDSSGVAEDDGLELVLLRGLYPEASTRALLQMGVERVAPPSTGVAAGLYEPEDLELLASRAIEQTVLEDDRRQRLISSATEITEATNQPPAAASSMRAAATAD